MDDKTKRISREERFKRLVERQTNDKSLIDKKLKDHRKLVFKSKKEANDYSR